MNTIIPCCQNPPINGEFGVLIMKPRLVLQSLERNCVGKTWSTFGILGDGVQLGNLGVKNVYIGTRVEGKMT